MDYHVTLAIIALIFVIVAFILMQISKRKFTEGYFKRYMNLVVISGTLMSIYLLLSLLLKLELEQLTDISMIIKALAYIFVLVASLVLIKSSKLLDKMSKKYTFRNKKFFKQFKS